VIYYITTKYKWLSDKNRYFIVLFRGDDSMKKIVSILILVMIVVISGRSNREVSEHHYIYRGEKNLWNAEYKVDATVTFFKIDGVLNVETYKERILTVTYKGDISDLSKVKHLIISYNSSAGGGSLDEEFDSKPPTENIYTLKSSSTGTAIENEEETIQVTINIDGEIQTIELTNTK